MSWQTYVKWGLHSCRINECLVRSQRSRLLILCYHGVLSERRQDSWSYENWVDAESFRMQLRWLRGRLEPIDLSGLERWRTGGWTGARGPVLITFDDGYRNNRSLAAPILVEESCPALFFLSTGLIGTKRVLWNDELRVRVMNWPNGTIRLPGGDEATISRDRGSRRALAGRINKDCKQLPQDQCSSYLRYLRSLTMDLETLDDREAREFMSWDDAKELVRCGFDIGSHTVEHPILARIPDRTQLQQELRSSKGKLESELGRTCSALAYPNGTFRDVSPQVIEEARAAGYRWGFMTTPTWQALDGDPYKMSRICVPGHVDMSTFAFYASGLHARLSGSA